MASFLRKILPSQHKINIEVAEIFLFDSTFVLLS